jgi:hypothetical protein
MRIQRTSKQLEGPGHAKWVRGSRALAYKAVIGSIGVSEQGINVSLPRTCAGSVDGVSAARVAVHIVLLKFILDSRPGHYYCLVET